MKLTKQKIVTLIKEALDEMEIPFPGKRGVDLYSLDKRYPGSYIGDPEDLIKMAFMTGARNKPLPKEWNDGTGPIYAAWVEGKVKYDTWLQTTGEHRGDFAGELEGHPTGDEE